MQGLFQLALTSRAWPIWVRYFVTTCLVLLALWMRRTLLAEVPGYPFLLFYPIIIVTGVFFDRGNGIYATLLSALLSAYYLMEPVGSLRVNDPGELLAIAIFVGTGLVAAALVEALHVAFIALSKVHMELDAAARQREILLDELSHRIRNDLAALASVLQIQARASMDPAVSTAILGAADRIHVMAQVHQRLALRDERVVVDSKAFVTELCGDLRTTLVGSRPVTVNVAAESHAMVYERAVPLGLMINELLTNAVKYAFPDDREGTIEVRFERQGDTFRLTVADDGVGLAGPTLGTGFGHKLVSVLATQVGGSLEAAESETGAVFIITFPTREAK